MKLSIKKEKKQIGPDNTLSSEILKFNDESVKVRKICKVLRLGNFFTNFFICCFFLVFIVVQIKLADFEILSQAVEDLATMRGCIVRISANARSLELLKHQEAVYYDSIYYKQKLIFNSDEIKERLLGLDKYNSVFPIESKLKNQEIVVVQCYNNTCSMSGTNLYQGILDLNLKVSTWVGSGMNDEDALLYIYNNAFNRLFTDLNNTIYSVLDDIHLKTVELFWFFIKIKSIIFIPLTLLLILSLGSLYYLDKINRQQWNYLSDVSTQSLIQIRIKVVNRIKVLNECFVSLDSEKSRRPMLFEHFWVWYILSYCFLFTLSLIFCIIIVFDIEQPLFDLSLTHISNTFWSGSRLSVIFNCFLWGREEYLMNTKFSYKYLFTDYYQSPTPKQLLTEYLNELSNIEKYSLEQINNLNTKGYNFNNYFTYLSGSPCEILKITNCTVSTVSKGIHPALSLYIQDIELLISSPYTKNSPLLKRIEYDLETIYSALITSFAYLSDKLHSYTLYYTNLSIILCIIWIILLLISFHFAQKQTIQKIELSLLSKNELILLLQDTRISRTQQSLIESQPSHLSYNTLTK